MSVYSTQLPAIKRQAASALFTIGNLSNTDGLFTSLHACPGFVPCEGLVVFEYPQRLPMEGDEGFFLRKLVVYPARTTAKLLHRWLVYSPSIVRPCESHFCFSVHVEEH